MRPLTLVQHLCKLVPCGRYEEPEWLEGELGLRDVLVAGNTIVDPVSESTHVDVMRGLTNISCFNNTFIVHGAKTVRSSGC